MLYKIRLKPFREQKFTLKKFARMPVLRFLNEQNSVQRDAHTTRRLQQGGAKKYRPAADPLPGAQDGQNLTNWNGHYLHPHTQPGEDRCTQSRVIVATDPQTNTPTNPHTNSQTGPNTIHCAAKLSAQCNNL